MGRRRELTKSHINSKVSFKPSASNALQQLCHKVHLFKKALQFFRHRTVLIHIQKIFPKLIIMISRGCCYG